MFHFHFRFDDSVISASQMTLLFSIIDKTYNERKITVILSSLLQEAFFSVSITRAADFDRPNKMNDSP